MPRPRELAGAAAAALGLAVAMTWPTLRHPRTTVPGDLGDPLLQAWQLAWDGHALVHRTGAVFDANAFWPLRHTLAFSDSLLGYAPAGLVGRGPDAALLRYNLVYVAAYALAFLGPYLLARQLGVRPLAAAVAGAATAYAPWRIAHAGHLNVLSTGGVALAFALLLRGQQRDSPSATLGGWLVAGWQLTLGFALGLPFGYAVLVVTGALLLLRRPRRAVLLAHLGGAAVFAGIGLAMAAPYLSVVAEHPQARRTAAEVALYSPPLWGFLVAPAGDRLWGRLSAGPRARLGWPPEMALGVGATVLVLAVAGLVLARWSRRRRLALGAVALGAALLGAGTTLFGGRYSYLPLLDHLPGWQGLRTPGRLVVYVSLGLGLLAAGAVDALGRRRGLRWVPAVALLGVLAEGLATLPHPRPDPIPAAFRGAPAPILVLPSDQISDTTAMLWSTAGFPALLNGSSGFVPAELVAVREQARAFPGPAAVAALRRLGVHSVVVRPGTPAPPAPDGTVRRTAYADGSVRYLLAGSP